MLYGWPLKLAVLGVFMSNANDRITAIAASLLHKRGLETFPGRSDNLREAGLTSLDMAHLMLAITAEFGMEISQSAMTPDNFATVAAIESLVSVTAQAA